MNTRRSPTTLFAVLACFAALVASSVALAEPDAYLRIKGTKTGDFKGSVTMKGREGTISVNAVEHTLQMPTDQATGMPTGRRQHKPFVITKEIDRSSPLLREALTGNEILSEVTLQFYAPSAKSGAEVNHFTITLKNARITNVQLVMDDNRKTDAAKLPAYERVSFTYETITWTWEDGGISASDNWGGAAAR